jgi:transcriptional regulator with XRE-family HTH domain
MSSNPVARRLKEARLKAGLSQKELGIRAGIDEFSASPRINQYEKAKHTPDYTTLVQLGAVLDVPVPYFFCEDDLLAEVILRFGALHSTGQQRLLTSLQGESKSEGG